MLTQDLLAYDSSMLVGGRTSGVWSFPYHPNNAAHYFKGNQLDFDELKNKNVSLLYWIASTTFGWEHIIWVYIVAIWREELSTISA